MNKKIIALLIASAGVAAMVPMVFAETSAMGAGTTTQHFTTPPTYVTPAATLTKIACVGTAVNARETAIDAGYGTYSQAMIAAFAARATALQQAYTATSTAAVRTATNAAWSAYGAATKSAASAWSATRTSAWNQFYTATKACRAPSSVTNG